MSRYAKCTGDINNALQNLKKELLLINNTTFIDWTALANADTSEYLQILRYLFIEYIPILAERINQEQNFLAPDSTSSEHEFLSSIYRIARDEFDYRVIISKERFLTDGFGREIKAHILADLIRLARNKFATLFSSPINRPRSVHLSSYTTNRSSNRLTYDLNNNARSSSVSTIVISDAMPIDSNPALEIDFEKWETCAMLSQNFARLQAYIDRCEACVREVNDLADCLDVRESQILMILSRIRYIKTLYSLFMKRRHKLPTANDEK
ncbi:hypothetical protein GJ496_003967 [Pomphorhynchus laevis]|nr:hypothetical protein GJ496_003967 [Pomphorhynchus laevis]